MNKIAFLLAVMIILMTANASAVEYYMHGTIEAIDYIEDTFKIVSEDGHVWCFNQIEDWWIGDCVLMLMDDNGTSDCTDDICLSLRYICNP